MPYFENYSEVRIDASDFLSACDSYEIRILIDLLKKEGHLSNIQLNLPEDEMNYFDTEWFNICEKLSNIRQQISNEDQKTIMDIVNKY